MCKLTVPLGTCRALSGVPGRICTLFGAVLPPSGREDRAYTLGVHHAAYFFRILSRNVFESAVTLQASGQKHRSTHHQSLGTPAWFSAGSSLSNSSLPVSNGLCVLVLCSFRLPSESIRWTCVILPFNFSSSSRAPPG